MRKRGEAEALCADGTAARTGLIDKEDLRDFAFQIVKRSDAAVGSQRYREKGDESKFA